jgi:hypothetical protein
MTVNNLSLANIDNYVLGSCYTRTRYQKGGVCIFVRKELCFSQVDLSTYCLEKILKVCAVKIESVGLGLVVLCVYRSPAGDFSQFLNRLEQVLLFLYEPSIELLICGDFNVDYLLTDHRKQQLSVLLNTFNLVHTVNFPTRLHKNHASAIDNIFVDRLMLSSCVTVPLSYALSDHQAQCFIFDGFFATSSKINNSPRFSCKSRLITSDTIKYFTEQLSHENWNEVYLNNYVN